MKKTFYNSISKSKEFLEINKSLKEGISPIYLHGLWSSVSAHLISAITNKGKKNTVIIVSDEIEAKLIEDDLKMFYKDVYRFPHREITFFDSFAHSRQIENKRIETINNIVIGSKGIFILTIDSIMQNVSSIEKYKNSILFDFSSTYDLEKLLIKLIEFGYERTELVESLGQFSIRGGILDIYSPMHEFPIRIEFFDDEIDSIRYFDLTNQLSIDKIDEAIIYVAREDILLEKEKIKLICALEKISSKEKTNAKVNELLDNLKNNIVINNLINYIGLIDDEKNTILDYFDNDSIVFFVNPLKIKEKAKFIREDFVENFKNNLENKKAFKEQSEIIMNFEFIVKKILKHKVVALDTIKKQINFLKFEEILKFNTIEAPLYHSKMDNFCKDIESFKYRGYKIIIVLNGNEKCERFKVELEDRGITANVDYEFFNEILTSQITIGSGELREGYILSTFKLIVLTEKEIFGLDNSRRIRKKRSKDRIIKSFNELTVGSYVVHENHGIGKYIGIDQLSVDGMKKDYLKIKYSGEDFLYIPVEQMDSLQKYIGSNEDKTKLSKMGGSEWKKSKTKVKKAIEDITEELMKLYSARSKQKGFVFSKDTEWQNQFESIFPYQETEDQLKCIEEIKSDMEKELPMERLLCGDVGYGKTEVAIRAVFKAVMDSKQVAILVPTTILAQQHYTNLVERFSKFPVRVDMLSRFRTKKQQDVIIENVRTGVVDVIIGTHRILSKDMEFKDLGLLIIDEEQRFGVKHKEKIKHLKKSVDVLSLTATPIPRTLHMSLIGIRDMSVIEDPPLDRYPIQTYVVEFDDNLIAEAISREVSRGGQVYFVHNRVNDIDKITLKLQSMVQGVDIRYAHGQMSERKLEKIMIDFTNKEFDVLVCTTIIETGLDIANTNTIIINNADKMGLSQLYQLRGRVGRSNRIAYAYLMYQKDKVLTEVAEKRLKALKEFTELGAGFKISMKDLEIRGTGNILGSQQHGHLASIGYEMYCKMLEESVSAAKGEIVVKPIETLVEFNINAYIPDDFVTVEEHKLDLYKKISSVRGREDCNKIEEEIEDRFGTLPQSVYNLIEISYAKSLGQTLRILVIRESDDGFSLKLDQSTPIDPRTIEKCFDEFKYRMKFNVGGKPYIKYRYIIQKQTKVQKLKELINVLEKINGFQFDDFVL
ncbi:transcription-repair coupling factor [Helicovermis profundi]|uniref:Transcription-repair-coupling factor n=1 Tax=Helicovermis profundi TaxID=3065157 RepID=A0AAU9E0T0_9FIRM|nr:transcription-repair coupling factor [Clostridia bacterium S502]